MKKTFIALTISLAVILSSWYMFSDTATKIKPSSQSATPTNEGSSGVVETSQSLEAINLKHEEMKKEFIVREKELAARDKKALEMIKKIEQENGLSEEEFQEKYKKIFERMKEIKE